MAFISSSNTNSGKSEVFTIQGVSTSGVQVSTASTNVAAASLSHDTVCAYIATQPNGSQIKYEDITQIDDDDIEEMDIKWNLALLSMRADRSPRNQDRGNRENYKKDPKVEETAPKAMIAIDDIGWDWSYMAEQDENYALVADEEELNEELSDCETDLYNYKRGLSQVEARLVEFKQNEIKFYERIRVLERDLELRDNKIENLRNELEELKKEKESIDFKIEKFENASKDLDSLLGSQRPDKDKKGLGFNEPTPSVDVSKGVSSELEETGCPSVSKTKNTENSRKPTVKYAEMYRNISQSPRVRGNQRNWNNQKSQQLGKEFVMKNKACYNCGSFEHLKFECKQNIWVVKGKTLNSTHPKLTSFVETAHSHVKRLFVRKSAVKNKVWVPTVRTKFPTVGSKVHTAKPIVVADKGNNGKAGIPQHNIDDKGYWDSDCSRHMTGNISYLSEYEPYNGGYVSFGHGRGKITSKGTIKTDFKLVDDTHVLLRTPRQQNMYSIELKNIVPHKNLTCLIAKASEDESMLWHRRLGHLNFKTMNKLVRNNLVRGLPSKSFESNHTCVACLKGKQHKASCKNKLVNSVSKPLHTLHMDLFGPTSVSSLNHKWYCLVVTDDFSRFTWTFFLKSKNETSSILRNFITEIENLKDLNVKITRCDNGGEFRNREMDEFCSKKGIKRKFSNAITPQQNEVAERRNRTLIEAARTISPAIGFLRPFGCHVMILNTLDHLGKFDAKGDEGAGSNWLFDIDSLTKSMNYVPVVVTGTSSTNISGTKEVANQAMEENVSTLRFIALPNWFDEAHMTSSHDSSRKSDAFSEKGASQNKQDSNADVFEISRNTNPTATLKDPTANQVELVLSSTVETEVPTVSSPVPTDCLSIPPVSSSGPRIISRGFKLSGNTILGQCYDL
ncbi:putative ribonuclease H-like domain-containing protein [Tanacetum coccineum]